MTQDARMELLDAVFATTRQIGNACDTIEDIAGLLDEVGLERIATRLHRVVAPLLGAAERLKSAHSGELTETLHHNQQMTDNLLLAALKGCFVPPSEEKVGA